ISNTVISIFTVPDLCGVPPSTAISLKERRGCSSLSRAFCRIISANLLPSGFACCFRTKLSLRRGSIVTDDTNDFQRATASLRGWSYLK
uniref:Uncharacterized protein n=1 Tax=Monopterus albus TaxID=43700 RepID=A0A3Q3QX53_MONAL